MRCEDCGFEGATGLTFCGRCGARLAAGCPSCGFENPDGFNFCGACGAPLDGAAARRPAAAHTLAGVAAPAPRDYTPKHLADKILQSKSALEGERKQVTVLFADVKGSMELAEQLDPEQWHAILDRFFAILTDGVHRFEGTVNQYTGDGIMALFGAPIAHEDHAQRACYAALHLRDAVREYANEVRVQHGVPFGVRIGLSSGEVVVGRIGDDLRMDYTAQGHVVGLAQRMEALAESGHICLSEHTARLVEGYFELNNLGRSKVKGVSDSVGLFDLQGVGSFRTRLDRSRARGLSTFVGRDTELAALGAALDQALAGQGRIVGVVADAGVGKSRLCFEFAQRCRDRGIAVYEAHCPAHGKTVAHLPILELLRAYFGVSDADSARATREKIAGRLLLLDHAFEPLLPLVWDFLRVPDPERPVDELEPSVRQQQLHEFARRLVRAQSEREPAAILLDDLHWIDPASDELLAKVVEAVRGTRTLLLGNFRPEYRADWMQRADYQQLPLTPLGSEAIRALVGQLLGPDPSVVELPAVIEARTGGNPFFTEEVVASLIESEQLVGARGAYRLVGSVDRVEIPATVHAVLAARIDRLAEREKRVLQTAGIIGRNFARPLLSRIATTHGGTLLAESDLDAALRLLCDLDLLFERALYPVAEYAFKHPLTHEVAYGSQLRERRRAVHASLARVLEGEHESPALIAHHWDEAGEAEPAAHWHWKAALGAGVQDAAGAALHLERACDLVATLAETRERLSLAAAAGSQLLWIETRRGISAERALVLYQQARAAAQRSSDLSSLAFSQIAYSNYRLHTGQPGSYSAACQALTEAQHAGDRGLEVVARWSCSGSSFFTGDLSLTVEHCRAGIVLCGDDMDIGAERLGYNPWVFLRSVGAGALAMVGRLSEGTAYMERAFADHGPRYRYTQAVCGAFGMVVQRVIGDYRAALAIAQRSFETLEELSSTAALRVFLLLRLGQAHALVRDYDAAREVLETSLQLGIETNTFRVLASETHAWLARVALERGELDLARREVEAAIELTATEQAHARAQAHIVHARLACSEGSATPLVEHELAEALRCAREVTAVYLLPEIHQARAAMFARERRLEERRHELERARDLYREMGATQNAERVAVEMAETVG